MKVSELFPSNFLKDSDLGGRQVPVVIESWEQVDIGEDKGKFVLNFVGKSKSLVCNRTNAAAIAVLHGEDTDGWIGKKIVLFPTSTTYMGKPCGCIRILPPPAPVAATAEDNIPF